MTTIYANWRPLHKNITLGRTWIFNHLNHERWCPYDIEPGEYNEKLDDKGKQIKELMIYGHRNNNLEIESEMEPEFCVKFIIGLNWDLWVLQEKEQFTITEWIYTSWLEGEEKKKRFIMEIN